MRRFSAMGSISWADHHRRDARWPAGRFTAHAEERTMYVLWAASAVEIFEMLAAPRWYGLLPDNVHDPARKSMEGRAR